MQTHKHTVVVLLYIPQKEAK